MGFGLIDNRSMRALELALRALGSREFELLVTALLKAKYPRLEIKHVDGSGGDGGLDVIHGDLDGQLRVWQCKAFQGEFGAAQKSQVKKSLERVMKTHAPKKWSLCTTIDLGPRAMSWWQKMARKTPGVELELMQASDIITDLMYYATVRETFLPATVLNIPLLRAARSGTAELNDAELARVVYQNADLLLERFGSQDGRFSYAIALSRDRPPDQNPHPGALMSFSTAGKTVNVFPRDLKALEDKPLTFQFVASGTGVEKIRRVLETGESATLSGEEVDQFMLDLGVVSLLPAGGSLTSVRVGPTETKETLPLRVSVGRPPYSYMNEFVEFKFTALGSRQVTLQSVTPLPFAIRLVVNSSGAGKFTLQRAGVGLDVRRVARAAGELVRALGCPDTPVEFYNLKAGQTIWRGNLNGTVPKWLEEFSDLVRHCAEISEEYSVCLAVPDRIEDVDIRNVAIIWQLKEGRAVPIGKWLSFSVEQPPDRAGDATRLEGDFVIGPCNPPPQLTVFGVPIPIGPVCFRIPKGRVREAEEFSQFHQKAPPGATMNITIETSESVTIERATG